MQLFNESSAFRSMVKTIARSLIKDQYRLYPGANDPGAPTSFEGVKAFIKNRVNNELLCGDMPFLKGPPDERVRISFFSYMILSLILYYREMCRISLMLPLLPSAAHVSMIGLTISASFFPCPSVIQFLFLLSSSLLQRYVTFLKFTAEL